jgi:hypothetical protein
MVAAHLGDLLLNVSDDLGANGSSSHIRGLAGANEGNMCVTHT